MKYTAAQVRKVIVAIIGFVVTSLTTILAVGPEVIPVEWLPYINIVVALGTTYGVFQVKNAPHEGGVA